MSLLQYTSKEMYSSTELIRKSKNIFDKLCKHEIEKAIILRDGKPSFMLLEFNKYEDLITEYLAIKEELELLKKDNGKSKKVEKKEMDIEFNPPLETTETQEEGIDESENIDEINGDDLEEALAKIEELEINLDSDSILNEQEEAEKKQKLKEFWD